MLKKTVTYESIFSPGEMVTEDLYFNLTLPEMIAYGETLDGGLSAAIDRATQAKHVEGFLGFLQGLVGVAYGEKQGDRFVKSNDISEQFLRSKAWEQLYSDLLLDPTKNNGEEAAAFVNNLIPPKLLELSEKISAQAKAKGVDPVEVVNAESPVQSSPGQPVPSAEVPIVNPQTMINEENRSPIHPQQAAQDLGITFQ